MKKIKTVKEFLYEFFTTHKEQLCHDYPGLRAEILLDKYLKWRHLEDHVQAKDFFLNPNDPFFNRVLEGIPFEYLLSSKFFYNHNFYVNHNVLIPRNETEILVEDAVNYIKKNYHEEFKMIEVGTGSGCISVSILCEIDKKIQAIATDISITALEVARQNYFLLERLCANSCLRFINCDRLNGIFDKVDLIVSNPPYIKEVAGKKGVHNKVLEHEPHLALFIADNEYDQWFKEFFTQTSSLLKENGMLMMEGHEDTLEELAQVAKNSFSSYELKKDYTGSLRFLYLKK